MKYIKFIPGILFVWLLTGQQALYAQLTPDAPKTTTTVAGDSLKDVQILHAVKLQFKRVVVDPAPTVSPKPFEAFTA